jgi:hypothetical protein
MPAREKGRGADGGPVKSHAFTVYLDPFNYAALKEVANALYEGSIGKAARELIVRNLEEFDGESDLRRIAIALETIANSRRK